MNELQKKNTKVIILLALMIVLACLMVNRLFQMSLEMAFTNIVIGYLLVRVIFLQK